MLKVGRLVGAQGWSVLKVGRSVSDASKHPNQTTSSTHMFSSPFLIIKDLNLNKYPLLSTARHFLYIYYIIAFLNHDFDLLMHNIHFPSFQF